MRCAVLSWYPLPDAARQPTRLVITCQGSRPSVTRCGARSWFSSVFCSPADSRHDPVIDIDFQCRPSREVSPHLRRLRPRATPRWLHVYAYVHVHTPAQTAARDALSPRRWIFHLTSIGAAGQ